MTSGNLRLERADYWSRTITTHDPAHIVAGSTDRGHRLACGHSVTGGRVTTWGGIRAQQDHVCVGCIRAVTR